MRPLVCGSLATVLTTLVCWQLGIPPFGQGGGLHADDFIILAGSYWLLSDAWGRIAAWRERRRGRDVRR
jgi:hypothetical protein